MATEQIQSQDVSKILRDILPKGSDYHAFLMMYKMLTRAPRSISEIVKEKGINERTARKYMTILVESKVAEKVKNSDGYYQLSEHEYGGIELKGPIQNIPRTYFRRIPIIERWASLALGNPTQNKYLNKFESICYGEIVDGFKINPTDWNGLVDTERFNMMYRQQHEGKNFPVLERKTIRAFLSICLKLRFDKNDQDAKLLGLTAKRELVGKYKFVKLTPEEIALAKKWILSEGATLAPAFKITAQCIKAHFAFALEGFGRPSRVLTIETSKVERFKNKEGEEGEHLEWQQVETKQGKEYPKMMYDHDLVDWAWDWVKKRRGLKYKYLFVDDNDYEIAMYDDAELADERRPFNRIYKEMFKAIGKTEDYYFTNTLYCMRHAGVHLWLARLGYAGMVIIQTMGWEDQKTLLDHYAGITGQDIREFFSRNVFAKKL